MLTFQGLIPSTDRPFELKVFLRAAGYPYPRNATYVAVRHYLREKGFVQFKVDVTGEYWIRRDTMTDDDVRQMRRNLPEDIWTLEGYAVKHFQAFPPYTPLQRMRIAKAMVKAGYRPRNQGEYWSPVMKRRLPAPRTVLPKPAVPRRPKYPPGIFNSLDFMHINAMRRTPENVQWTKEHLRTHCTLIGTKWAHPDANGTLPAAVTGQWVAPGPAFTTSQFQQTNNARRVTADEWKSAVAWLAANGFIFRPIERRWVKA